MRRRVTALAVSLVSLVGAAGLTALPAQAAASPAALRVLPLGDSITWGQGSSTGNGYREPLWEDLTSQGHVLDFVGSGRNGSMSDADNEGHSGLRIDQISALTDAALARYKPNVVTLEAGTNDLNQNFQTSTAGARLSSLVDQIVADDPTATVVVGSLIVSTNAVENQSWASYNATIQPMVASKQAAGKHVEFVSMSAITTSDLSDQYHPNDGGYQKMGDAFDGGIQAADASGWLGAPAGIGGAVAGTAARVTSGIAGMCLDDFGGSNANGTKIEIWGCNGTGAQQWTAYSDGTLRVEGKCLDATAFGTANGTRVELWDCNGGANQVWQQYKGAYANPLSGRCLDDPAQSNTNGTGLQLYDCNGTIAQQWSTLQRD